MTINPCSDQRDKHLKVSSCTFSTLYHHDLFADLFFFFQHFRNSKISLFHMNLHIVC